MVWILICVKLAIPFIFTVIQRVKTGLFGKSNSVSYMYRWFVYDSMEHWIVPRQGHLTRALFLSKILFANIWKEYISNYVTILCVPLNAGVCFVCDCQQTSEKNSMRLIECSSPRKSLVKGDRFMRVKRNQSLTSPTARPYLLFSIICLLFVATASRYRNVTMRSVHNNVIHFGMYVRHGWNKLQLTLRIARCIEDGVTLAFLSHFLTNFATSATIFSHQSREGFASCKKCSGAHLFSRSIIKLTLTSSCNENCKGTG